MVQREKYVVLDVETNGLQAKYYDLLSISIYKPDDGKMFNKFLPLEKQTEVLTTEFNGITKEMLENATPLTQDDVDKIIDEFEIKDRIVLTYGDLDKKFLKTYFTAKKLKGFDLFSFFNFKENIFSSSFQSGNVTKDNLCRMYDIENVKDVHSGINDCVLEWSLFEKMDLNKLIVINDNVYIFNDDYKVPVSYVSYYKRLKKHLSLPLVSCRTVSIYKKALDKKRLKRFSYNASGVAFEHVLNCKFNVERVDSHQALFENISKMEYIGKLPSVNDVMLVSKNDDGTLTAINEEDKVVLDEINRVSDYLNSQIDDLIVLINSSIFKNEKVLSQELVMNEEHKLLALCDLSNEFAVIEIKTIYELDINEIALQLYIQSKSRPMYILYINWKDASINLDKVEFVFKEDALQVIEDNRVLKLKKEQEHLQHSIFDEKSLELIKYTGKGCISEFKCRKCEKTYKFKKPLTLDSIYYDLVKCPYCNPSFYPMGERSTPSLQMLYDRSRFLKNIKIENWVMNDEVYVRCERCGYKWCDNINNVLNDTCPKCITNCD